MGRVSLTEDYDDRSVIAKLNEMDKRVKGNTTVVTSAEASAKASAQAAQETADRFAGSVGAVVQNANAQIDASKAQVDQAKAEVDETVTTVAQAVQTANNASASAQQSAQTVAGYDTRLTAVEDADTQNVKLEGNQTITGSKTFTQLLTSKSSGWRANWIVPFYSKSMVLQPSDDAVSLVDDVVQDSQANLVSVDQIIHNNMNTVYRDWQLQAAHGNVDMTLEINANGERYATAPTPSSNAPSTAIVNKAYVESTDGVTNNLVHRTTNEKVNGIKTFIQRVDFDSSTVNLDDPPSYASRGMSQVNTGPDLDVIAMREEMVYSAGGNSLQFIVHAHGEDEAHTEHTATLMLTVFRDGTARLRLVRASGTVEIVPRG